MDKELVQLLEKLCDLPDDVLIKMVNQDSAKYHSEAIALAKIVMKRRGYNLSRKGNIIDNSRKQPEPDNTSHQSAGGEAKAAEADKLAITIYCPRCNARLEYVGTRRLNEEKSLAVLGELGEMYKNGAYEFLDVYTCRHCGHVEFFVDGVGDELRPY